MTLRTANYGNYGRRLIIFIIGNAGFMSSTLVYLGPSRVVASVFMVHILRQVASVWVQVDHGKQGFGFRV